ncbi:MAG TPA: helix-turn-helix domain-containing protein [Solirubrobacteraceae bacterium]|nr:helix-turn-helix domain-containing protein [Solirubrobacteraceae bacterium]
MTEPDAQVGPENRWLTVAEIASELRVNPATVRLWISKGTLPAKRAGRRKLLILRSDLDRMLEDTRRESPPGGYLPQTPGGYPQHRPPPLSRRQLSTADIHGRQAEPGEMEQIIAGIQQADEIWATAQAASENAPPDPGFALRVRVLADACEQQANWLLTAAQTRGFEWTPLPDRRGVVISHELRPGANRPGPPELWDEFDRAVQRLGIAMEGRLMYSVAWAYRSLAEVMHTIADALLDEEDYGEGQRP